MWNITAAAWKNKNFLFDKDSITWSTAHKSSTELSELQEQRLKVIKHTICTIKKKARLSKVTDVLFHEYFSKKSNIKRNIDIYRPY